LSFSAGNPPRQQLEAGEQVPMPDNQGALPFIIDDQANDLVHQFAGNFDPDLDPVYNNPLQHAINFAWQANQPQFNPPNNDQMLNNQLYGEMYLANARNRIDNRNAYAREDPAVAVRLDRHYRRLDQNANQQIVDADGPQIADLFRLDEMPEEQPDGPPISPEVRRVRRNRYAPDRFSPAQYRPRGLYAANRYNL